MTAATLTKPYRSNKYRDLTWYTHELIRQYEWLRWQLACLPDDCHDPRIRESTRALLVLEIEDLKAEIERRQRWKDSADAPAWPGNLPDLKPFWQDVKRRVSVVDFFEAASLSILRKSGNGYRAACPLCDATNQTTFSIFDDGRAWHCHRCYEGGDVFTLAAHFWRDQNFVEVAFSVADLFGIERPKNDSRMANHRAHTQVVDAGSARLVTVKVRG